VVRAAGVLKAVALCEEDLTFKQIVAIFVQQFATGLIVGGSISSKAQIPKHEPGQIWNDGKGTIVDVAHTTIPTNQLAPFAPLPGGFITNS